MKRSISILLMAALLLTGILPVRTSGQSREGSLITQNRICSDTGETPEVSECQHTFGAWSEAGGGHSRVCSKCGAAESGAHTWNDGTVTVAPTLYHRGHNSLFLHSLRSGKNGKCGGQGAQLWRLAAGGWLQP